jgi:hypothetical protein
LIEMRSPCSSSSQTFSTVPAFPSARMTALPINSDCVSPYSLKIFDARTFTDGIARPCSAEPPLLSKVAQRRVLPQRLGPETIEGDRSSNSRSRSICILSLAGSSGSGFSDARSLSPISRTMARLCTWSMWLRITESSVATTPPAGRYQSCAPPDRARLANFNETGGRRFWLSARALVLRTAGHKPLAIRDMRRVSAGERRSHAFVKSRQTFSFLISDRDDNVPFGRRNLAAAGRLRHLGKFLMRAKTYRAAALVEPF